MERVAFLLEQTGERLPCLLNPERVVVRRAAGLRRRQSSRGALTGSGMADDPLLYTGGGSTELQLDLLFDVSLAEAPVHVEDVRELTAPFWELAENVESDERYGRPPLVRFVWGKRWNIPGIVAAVAERLEYFTANGDPTRSWLRMRFLRVSEPITRTRVESIVRPPAPEESLGEVPPRPETPPGDVTVHELVEGERLDQIVHRYFGYHGHPSLWRWLAEFNDIADPLHIPAGSLLEIPPLQVLEGKRWPRLRRFHTRSSK